MPTPIIKFFIIVKAYSYSYSAIALMQASPVMQHSAELVYIADSLLTRLPLPCFMHCTCNSTCWFVRGRIKEKISTIYVCHKFA